MNPGRIVCPLTSWIFAPGGIVTAPRLPTATMRLSVTTTSEFAITSSPFMVITLPPRSTTVPLGCRRGTSSATSNFSDGAAPALSFSNVTAETGCRKNVAPTVQVMVLPPSAHAKLSEPDFVRRCTGSDGVDTLTLGASVVPACDNGSRYNCVAACASTHLPSGEICTSSAGVGSGPPRMFLLTTLMCVLRSVPS